MQQITYSLDDKTYQSIAELCEYFNATDSAEVIKKSLALLQVAAYVKQTDGEIIIRKGNHETKLIVE